MKVFVTGATGYIGFTVALALRRAGHHVIGLVRNQDGASRLARHEVLTVVADLRDLDAWTPIAEQCSVLIHTAFDSGDDAVAIDRTTIAALIEAGATGARPKTIIYTSGVWVHGSTGEHMADETSPLAPAEMVAWRPLHERMVLDAPGVRSLVLRPGCCYGRQGGLSGMWFEGATQTGPIEVVGSGDHHWAMIHIDDLAEAYVRAAESGLSGETFLVVDGSRATVRQCVTAAAVAAGHSGALRFLGVDEARARVGELAVPLAFDQHLDGRKAVRLLDWAPKHRSFAADAATYYAAWRSYR